eukprot:4361968-Amphidinium_carterae.1
MLVAARSHAGTECTIQLSEGGLFDVRRRWLGVTWNPRYLKHSSSLAMNVMVVSQSLSLSPYSISTDQFWERVAARTNSTQNMPHQSVHLVFSFCICSFKCHDEGHSKSNKHSSKIKKQKKRKRHASPSSTSSRSCRRSRRRRCAVTPSLMHALVTCQCHYYEFECEGARLAVVGMLLPAQRFVGGCVSSSVCSASSGIVELQC